MHGLNDGWKSIRRRRSCRTNSTRSSEKKWMTSDVRPKNGALSSEPAFAVTFQDPTRNFCRLLRKVTPDPSAAVTSLSCLSSSRAWKQFFSLSWFGVIEKSHQRSCSWKQMKLVAYKIPLSCFFLLEDKLFPLKLSQCGVHNNLLLLIIIEGCSGFEGKVNELTIMFRVFRSLLAFSSFKNWHISKC